MSGVEPIVKRAALVLGGSNQRRIAITLQALMLDLKTDRVQCAALRDECGLDRGRWRESFYSMLERGAIEMDDSGFVFFPQSHGDARKCVDSLVADFVAERCVVNPSAQVRKCVLVGSWKSWCAARKTANTLTDATFAKVLLRVVPSVRATRPQGDYGGRDLFWAGIGLLTARLTEKDPIKEQLDRIESKMDALLALWK